jgi:hypothetical protein
MEGVAIGHNFERGVAKLKIGKRGMKFKKNLFL